MENIWNKPVNNITSVFGNVNSNPNNNTNTSGSVFGQQQNSPNLFNRGTTQGGLNFADLGNNIAPLNPGTSPNMHPFVNNISTTTNQNTNPKLNPNATPFEPKSFLNNNNNNNNNINIGGRRVATILVSGIPLLYQNEDSLIQEMKKHFQLFGNVLNITNVKKKAIFYQCVVTFSTIEEASKAMKKGTRLKNTMLKIKPFISNSPPTTTTNTINNEPTLNQPIGNIANGNHESGITLSKQDESLMLKSQERNLRFKLLGNKDVPTNNTSNINDVGDSNSNDDNNNNKNDTPTSNDIEEEIIENNLSSTIPSQKKKKLGKVGTCLDFCPLKEKMHRGSSNDINSFERTPSGDIIFLKKYKRNVVEDDTSEISPLELRPPHILIKVMNYLTSNIIDQEKPFAEIQNFIRDRTRSLRQDLTAQHSKEDISINIHERCVRFHIVSHHYLCEATENDFNQFQNREQLNNCLTSLKQCYDDFRVISNGKIHFNEPEFRSYHILNMLENNADLLSYLISIPNEIRNHPMIQYAIEVWKVYRSENYSRFFNLALKGTYLQSCLLHRYFIKFRSLAVQRIFKAYKSSKSSSPHYPTADFLKLLKFYDQNELEKFVNIYSDAISIEVDQVVINSLSTQANKPIQSKLILEKAPKKFKEVIDIPEQVPIGSFKSVHIDFDEYLIGQSNSIYSSYKLSDIYEDDESVDQSSPTIIADNAVVITPKPKLNRDLLPSTLSTSTPKISSGDISYEIKSPSIFKNTPDTSTIKDTSMLVSSPTTSTKPINTILSSPPSNTKPQSNIFSPNVTMNSVSNTSVSNSSNSTSSVLNNSFVSNNKSNNKSKEQTPNTSLQDNTQVITPNTKHSIFTPKSVTMGDAELSTSRSGSGSIPTPPGSPYNPISVFQNNPIPSVFQSSQQPPSIFKPSTTSIPSIFSNPPTISNNPIPPVPANIIPFSTGSLQQTINNNLPEFKYPSQPFSQQEVPSINQSAPQTPSSNYTPAITTPSLTSDVKFYTPMQVMFQTPADKYDIKMHTPMQISDTPYIKPNISQYDTLPINTPTLTNPPIFSYKDNIEKEFNQQQKEIEKERIDLTPPQPLKIKKTYQEKSDKSLIHYLFIQWKNRCTQYREQAKRISSISNFDNDNILNSPPLTAQITPRGKFSKSISPLLSSQSPPLISSTSLLPLFNIKNINNIDEIEKVETLNISDIISDQILNNEGEDDSSINWKLMVSYPCSSRDENIDENEHYQQYIANMLLQRLTNQYDGFHPIITNAIIYKSKSLILNHMKQLNLNICVAKDDGCNGSNEMKFRGTSSIIFLVNGRGFNKINQNRLLDLLHSMPLFDKDTSCGIPIVFITMVDRNREKEEGVTPDGQKLFDKEITEFMKLHEKEFDNVFETWKVLNIQDYVEVSIYNDIIVDGLEFLSKNSPKQLKVELRMVPSILDQTIQEKFKLIFKDYFVRTKYPQELSLETFNEKSLVPAQSIVNYYNEVLSRLIELIANESLSYIPYPIPEFISNEKELKWNSKENLLKINNSLESIKLKSIPSDSNIINLVACIAISDDKDTRLDQNIQLMDPNTNGNIIQEIYNWIDLNVNEKDDRLYLHLQIDQIFDDFNQLLIKYPTSVIPLPWHLILESLFSYQISLVPSLLQSYYNNNLFNFINDFNYKSNFKPKVINVKERLSFNSTIKNTYTNKRMEIYNNNVEIIPMNINDLDISMNVKNKYNKRESNQLQSTYNNTDININNNNQSNYNRILEISKYESKNKKVNISPLDKLSTMVSIKNQQNNRLLDELIESLNNEKKKSNEINNLISSISPTKPSFQNTMVTTLMNGNQQHQYKF